jgi:signal transduction histidine kinase
VEREQENIARENNYNNHIPQEFSAMGLDMIDLASILESSQVLSSELEVDKLMGKMAEIITESATADLVGIVIKDDQTEWSIAAMGTPDGIETFPEGVGLDNDEIDKQVARQVTTYVLRFKETVFVHNLLEDERFSGVSQPYRERNPGGKAVIALPILHGNDKELLGSIYVEGPPNSFSSRNLTVLRLLVNQISISLANALWAKELDRISKENAAMVSMQRKALARAREAEAKARDAEAEAVRNMHLKEEAARAKSMFLANVSHELRTPLNGVIGMSEMLSGTNLTAQQGQFAESIRICADTLLSVINDLLDFTKLDAGKMNMALMPLNLTETIREVVRALSFQNNEKNLETIEDLRIDPDMLVIGDPVRLHQILMNLLSNSYKFTSNGTVTVKAIGSDEDSGGITFTVMVKDTGIGIPEEQVQKLFQPFSQVESKASRSFGGTGLGLSICKALVESLMGGRIWLESEPGIGTTVGFTIRFKKASKADISNAIAPPVNPPNPASPSRIGDQKPMNLPVRIAAHTPIVEMASRSDSPHFNDISAIPASALRICIAEDNLINQKIAISYVQRLGYECAAFVNGRKAIEAMEQASTEGRPFHVILMVRSSSH